MFRARASAALLATISLGLGLGDTLVAAYDWKQVKIGGGGGFVPGIVFNPSEQGVAYARTDIGGAYRLNPDDDTWTPILDFASLDTWNYWGVDALATDPVEPNRLYLATGLYTNDWDPNNGQILVSEDYGDTFTEVALDFKVGGNMPGRGMGERLTVDPNSNNILFFGARSGNGLWKSDDYGASWAQVDSFTSTGTFAPDPSDSSGYNADIIGLSWVTFDSTSGSSGDATPRIFVGIADPGDSSENIFVTEDAGETWSALPSSGTNSTFHTHNGVLSPDEGLLYVTYSDGAGPYDGANGAVLKYDIASQNWTDITPVSGSDLYFGFGGFAIDLQVPGTIMVAALNSWWPDGQIYRSTDSGATWSPLWDWAAYPTMNKYFSYDTSRAPWLGVSYPIVEAGGPEQIGWMMESLNIDPFDSDHWLYGTGATIYGGHDLTEWDTTHNVTLASLADGVEEWAVLGLVAPPGGPPLVSAIGDLQGFVHDDLDTAPETTLTETSWATSNDIDYAGASPEILLRVGTGDSPSGKQIALSSDYGSSWYEDSNAPDSATGGTIALGADGLTVLWSTSGSGVLVSQNSGAYTEVDLPDYAIITSDKVDATAFYAGSGASFYISSDSGSTFTETETLGDSNSVFEIAANPFTAGDVWVSTDKGLFHSASNGTDFTAVDGISQAWAIALGAPPADADYPAIFVGAIVDDVFGYYRSDDEGATWVQINDEAHGFASPSSNKLAADTETFGRVYLGAGGRGIFYGDA